MSPFSLYVHVPYCQTKCPYCDFNSYAATQWPEAEYTDALTAELDHYARQPEWQGRIGTIFLGGGTPSLFAAASIERVLAGVRRHWDLHEQAEITLEANPGTVTRETLAAFRAAGINRLSFGVQSFNPRHLQRLGRIHSADEAIAAIESARAAGFENVNFDLIFAVPGQTLAEWEADLRTAISLGTDHISAYNLTFEEGTAFYAQRAKGELRQAPEEFELAMFTRAQDVFAAAGYAHYEISNYARPGRECRHNLNYWQGGAYLAVGAGAHGFSHDPAPGRRWSNERNPQIYMRKVKADGHSRVFEERLDVAQAEGEFVFLNLRLREGFDSVTFVERFGVDFLEVFPHAAELRLDGLLSSTNSRWSLSERGLMIADSVFATFL